MSKASEIARVNAERPLVRIGNATFTISTEGELQVVTVSPFYRTENVTLTEEQAQELAEFIKEYLT